jgi:DNA-binding IclR family transcriptional regulator
MSIDIDEFETKSEEELAGATNAERVLRFLAANDDRAFEPGTIAQEAGVARNSVGSVLARLEERELVRHKASYWAITDDRERLRSAAALESTTAALNDRLGEEDPEEWGEHAADRHE